MTVSYDKLWKLLIDRRMRKIDLVNQSGISSNAMAKMGKREPVTLEALWRICLTLRCNIGDIVEFELPT